MIAFGNTINILFVIASAALLLPALVLLLECVASLLPRRALAAPSNTAIPPFAVLIPAHNESATLGTTLAATLQQVRPGDRVLVVADNCTDDTALIARAAGADVLERTDPVNRGKGFALAAGIARLSQLGAPAVLILLDADVAPPAGALATLAQAASRSSRPVQAIYLLHAADHQSAKAVVSELAFITKNLVRPLGLHNLRQPVLLTGTGIALPWNVLDSVDLASGDLVEDMKLGLDLLQAGHPPLLCPEVVIRGSLPDSSRTAFTQRTRWEHGHLSVIQRFVPSLIGTALRGRKGALAIGMDLLVPPLALLVGLIVVHLVAAATWVWFGGGTWPLRLSTLALLAVAIAVAIAWLRAGQHLPIWKLAAIPFYILWKLPMYMRFFAGRKQSTWVRTDRT